MSLAFDDISAYQSAAAAGHKGVPGMIIKATESNYWVSKLCNAQWDVATKADKLMGLYHYCSGSASAVEQARFFIKNIKNYVDKAALIIDWESGNNPYWGSTTFVKQFNDEVKRLTGKNCILYTGSDGVAQCQNVKNDCSGWLAGYPYSHYASYTPPSISIFNQLYNGHGFNLIGWQYSDYPVDHSVMWCDAGTWKKYYGKASASSKPAGSKPSTPAKKPTTPKWVAEKQNYKLKQAINLRTGATTSSSLIATLPAGSVVTSDQAIIQGNYRWIRQPRGNGKYGYLVTGPASNTLAYVTKVGAAKKATPKPAQTVYVVKSGDTLSGIAAKYGTTAAKLGQLNGLKNLNSIGVGQRLVVGNSSVTPKPAAPAKVYHKVTAGESVSYIAKKYGVSQQQIINLNGLKNANLIRIGQTLRIR